jgi:hypothetical protein
VLIEEFTLESTHLFIDEISFPMSLFEASAFKSRLSGSHTNWRQVVQGYGTCVNGSRILYIYTANL